MLSSVKNRCRGGEDGFTLMELLVVMLISMVVMGALLAILEGSMRSAQRTFTRVNATQRARSVLAQIENELHSACTAGRAPIEGVTNNTVQSDANNLVFLAFYGTSANPVPTWYRISYNAAAGTLTQSTYSAAGQSPAWTQGTLIGTTTLLTNTTRLPDGSPVFQYYSYQQEYTDSAGNQYMLIPDGTNALPNGSTPDTSLAAASGLSASDATNTVEVTINLKVGSDSGTDLNTNLNGAVGAESSDTISLRLTTPPNYVPAGSTASGYGSCQ